MHGIFNFAVLIASMMTVASSLVTKPNMSKRTVLNENYKGLVENFAIPAELHEVGGKKYATFGGVVPIHCCSPEQVSERAATTHHYCDIFTDDVLAPLAELAYVRLDESHAEKVFINRTKRLLLSSSDGRLAQWRSAPTFESANRYVAGAPVVDQRGALVSLVTARRGNHYAVSNIEGEGGYFETPAPWTVVEVKDPAELVYGDRTFPTREELRRHVAALPAPEVSGEAPTRPVLFHGRQQRLALVTAGGRQLAHYYLHGVQANDVEYL